MEKAFPGELICSSRGVHACEAMKDRELEAGVDNFEDESVDVSILSRGFRVGPILRNRLDPKLKRQVFPFRIAETRALFRLIALAKQVVSRPIG